MFKMVDGARVLLGARGLLAAPSVARTQFGREGPSGALVVLRVLGLRQIVQATVAAGTGWRALSAGVDLLHAISMLVPLALSPRRRGRFALLQIAAATVLIALELAADRHPRGSSRQPLNQVEDIAG